MLRTHLRLRRPRCPSGHYCTIVAAGWAGIDPLEPSSHPLCLGTSWFFDCGNSLCPWQAVCEQQTADHPIGT